jgi:short-subunit dehydrogenase
MKYVFITGAASGIGLATAKRFAQEGWFVGLYDINESAIKSLLATAEFKSSCGCRCDVTDRSSIEAAIEHFSAVSDGKMDVLINNAGVLSGGRFSSIDHKSNDLMIDVNVKGCTYLAQLAFPYLQKTTNAIMVNMCSASSIQGVPLLGVYGATKFYVDGLSQALNIEWAEDDIRVTAIKPSFVSTAMLENVPEQLMDLMGADLTAEDIVDAIWTAVHSNKQSIIIGYKVKLLVLLTRFLPNKMNNKLMAYLCGFR